MHKYAIQNSAQKQPSVSVVGARGYTGLELAKLLLQHPYVKLTHCFATQDFKLTDDLLDSKAKNVVCLPESEILNHLTDIVFLATPAEVSLKLAPLILAQGKKVVDLSGAFRLQKNDYIKWYGFEHTAKDWLQKAHYGLIPFSAAISSDTQLVSNPGCYASAISLALIPLLKKNLLQLDSIVIDAKSGTTGAGRKPSENILFSEVDGLCQPYRVGRHQHTPEIQEALENFGGSKVDFHLTTHLLPVKRGISAGIYAKTTAKSLEEVEASYAEAFGSYTLVRFGSSIAKLASLNQVSGSPFTHISYELNGNKLYVFSCLDNLLKGAASQAVENLNRLLDYPVSSGLTSQEVAS